VTVSASSPFQLPALSLATTYLVDFPAVPNPQLPALDLNAPQEGTYQRTLPLPPAAAGLPVSEVKLTFAGKPPGTRVLEPTLPSLAVTAFLGLQPGTTLVAELPAAQLATLQTLTALRLPLLVTPTDNPAGLELAPEMYTRDGPTGPLSPLPAKLAPVTVAAIDTGGSPLWVTLPFVQPLPVVPGQQLWLALGVVGGSATWFTAVPSPIANENASLGRLTTSGAFLELSSVENLLGGPFAAMRLVGTPLNPAACPALAVGVHPAAGADLFGVTPTATGTTVLIGLAAPITPTAAADGSVSLPLDVVVAAPGQYTLLAAAVHSQPPASADTSGGSR
jgi:hypothetical protein